MVTIQEFFDHRENVLGGYANVTLFAHNALFFFVSLFVCLLNRQPIHFSPYKSNAKPRMRAKEPAALTKRQQKRLWQ